MTYTNVIRAGWKANSKLYTYLSMHNLYNFYARQIPGQIFRSVHFMSEDWDLHLGGPVFYPRYGARFILSAKNMGINIDGRGFLYEE